MKTNRSFALYRRALTALSLAAALAATGLFSTARAGTVLTGSTSANGSFAVLVGGFNNNVNGFASGIITGASNSVTAGNSFIGCGNRNQVLTPSDSAAIVSGNDNVVSGVHGVITGGTFNRSSGFASLIHGNFISDGGFKGCVLFSDSNPLNDRSSTTPAGSDVPDVFGALFNEGIYLVCDLDADTGLVIRPSGTNTLTTKFPAFVGINKEIATHPLHIGTNGTNGNGAHCTTAGAFSNGSSREFKENFVDIDARDVLRKLAKLPVQGWNYKENEGELHIGPIAEEFRETFGLGHDDKYICTVDADGIALAAIKGLNEVVEEKDARIEVLEKSHATLEKSHATLEARLAKLEKLLETAAE